MKGMRWLCAIAVFGCAFAAAGSAGADESSRPALAAAPASAPPGYAVVESVGDAPDGEQSHASVTCPAGTVVWGGGVFMNSTSLLGSVNGSYPNVSSKKSWLGYVNNRSGEDTNFGVFAVCAEQPAGYRIVKKTVPSPGLYQAGGVATCPAGTFLLGGGGSSSSRSLSVSLNSSHPYSTLKSGWATEVSNATVSDATLTTYAICAKPVAGIGVAASTVTNPHGARTLASVFCPGVPVSGGVESSSKATVTTVSGTYPDASAWRVYENNASALDQEVTAWAICVS